MTRAVRFYLDFISPCAWPALEALRTLQLFGGRDRLPHLAARLCGRLAPAREISGPLLERPYEVERRR